MNEVSSQKQVRTIGSHDERMADGLSSQVCFVFCGCGQISDPVFRYLYSDFLKKVPYLGLGLSIGPLCLEGKTLVSPLFLEMPWALGGDLSPDFLSLFPQRTEQCPISGVPLEGAS